MTADFASWLAAYLAPLDDAGLAAHASAAMIARARADVAAAAATATVELGEVARVALGDNIVELDRAGLARSRCTCPAAQLVCRHRLAAVMVLRDRLGAAAAAAAAAAPAPAIDTLAALTVESIKHVFGPRLYARARAVFDRGEPVAIERGAQVRVTLPSGVTCTLSPLVGLDASACSCKRPFPCEHRAIAALALLGDDGRVDLAPRPARPRVLAGGRDEAAVVADVRALVHAIVQVGLDAANASWTGRAARLALVAHAVDLPALERELHALAEALELARRRSAAFDPTDTGDLLARIDWRCRALSGDSPFPRHELAGEHRRAYADVGALDLACLAIAPFRAADGMTGDVLHFHGGGAFHEHLVRRGAARGAIQLWGLADHRALVGRRVIVEQAKRSADGRLSGAAQTRAALGAVFDPCALELGVARTADFAELAHRVASIRRFTLRDAPRALPIVVAPARVEHVRHDGALGTVEASLVDAAGHTIRLVVAPRPGLERVAVDAAELLATRPPRQIFGRAWQGRAGPALEPIALFHDAEPRITSLGATPARPRVATPATWSPPPSRPLLDAVRAWQGDVLCAGVGTATPTLIASGHRLAAHLDDTGLGLVARALAAALAAPAAWLEAWAVTTIAAELE